MQASGKGLWRGQVQAQKISAWLAVALSVIGAPLKLVRVMRQAEPLPAVAYDYIALALLLVGAIHLLRTGKGRWLAGGWGFGCAMFYGSFTSHYWKLTNGAADLGFERTMVISTAAFLALNAVGLALALMEPRPDGLRNA